MTGSGKKLQEISRGKYLRRILVLTHLAMWRYGPTCVKNLTGAFTCHVNN
jgi:hypothetical protein